jgi:hypothetical protein
MVQAKKHQGANDSKRMEDCDVKQKYLKET